LFSENYQTARYNTFVLTPTCINDFVVFVGVCVRACVRLCYREAEAGGRLKPAPKACLSKSSVYWWSQNWNVETVERRRKSIIKKKSREAQVVLGWTEKETQHILNRYTIKYGRARPLLHWSGEGLKFKAFVNTAWGILFALPSRIARADALPVQKPFTFLSSNNLNLQIEAVIVKNRSNKSHLNLWHCEVHHRIL